MKEKIKELCRNKKYYYILKQISELERFEIEQGNPDPYGWEFEEIQGLSGAHLNTLLQKGIIKYGYKSNNIKRFKLVNLEEVETALSEIDAEAEAESDAEYDAEYDANVNANSELHNFYDITTDELEQIRHNDPINYLSNLINPKIFGMEHVKKAILLCLASHGDKFGDRGRVHVLMYGAPGSAKTALKDWVVYQLGALSCSQRTSKVGLTGDARGDEITPGALARAHKKVLAIDELDKFSNEDRQALLEAMEEGVVIIEAGGMSARFNAECRVIACANSIDKFSPELLDRFDFKIKLDTPTPEDEKKITSAVLDYWFDTKTNYDGRILRAYLQWIKDFEPQISKTIRENAKQLLSMYIDLDESVRGSIRKKESIIRVAFTIAKIHKRDVELRDFIEAIKLLNPEINGGKLKALETLVNSLENINSMDNTDNQE